MSDYLDVRIRGRSESVNTEASTTVVASLPSTPFSISKPPPSPLLSQVGPKVISNTILKSHGRPPWYFHTVIPKYREYLNAFVQVRRGWPADFACLCHWDSWYVDRDGLSSRNCNHSILTFPRFTGGSSSGKVRKLSLLIASRRSFDVV